MSETAPDPRVPLTEATRDACTCHVAYGDAGPHKASCLTTRIEHAIEQIIAARLAPIRALAERYEA